MRIETYRRVPFVDREEEEEFFIDWFNEPPQRILWVYGPKSSGKTTLISYVVDHYLLKKRKFWVKYFNLRETFISSYDSFLDTFFVEVEGEESEMESGIGINLFGFKSEVWQKIKKRKLNLFKEFVAELERLVEKKKKQCVMIVDEIQKLRDVYVENSNGERELLKEFLNLCVSLTKERHLSHVVILTSNTVFIERIYNDARLKKTSEFIKIDHLEKKQILEWLRGEDFRDEETELVWEYFGGCIPDIFRAIEIKRKKKDLKDFLERERWLAYTEIVDYLARGGFSKEEKEVFKNMCKEMLKKGYFEINEENGERYLPVIEAWAEKEILFYDPLELKVTGNSRIYEKGMELLFER